jgi:hypothetical protein
VRVNPPAASTASHWLAISACAVAVVGVAAVWTGVSMIVRGPCAWFAVLAALDAALLLRLANWPPGRSRVALALGVVALTVVCAAYFIATAQIGHAMGMRPYEALPLMSFDLASLYARSNVGWAEGLWLALALVVAWRGAK